MATKSRADGSTIVSVSEAAQRQFEHLLEDPRTRAQALRAKQQLDHAKGELRRKLRVTSELLQRRATH